jgi:hypothetical protein
MVHDVHPQGSSRRRSALRSSDIARNDSGESFPNQIGMTAVKGIPKFQI